MEPDDIDRFVEEHADRYLAMGFTQFTLGFNGPEWSVERGLPFLEWRDRVNADRRQEASAEVAAQRR